MPFHDLNLPYTTNHADLSYTLLFHAELGYSVVAIAQAITGKLPPTVQPIPLTDVTLPKGLKALTRLTLTISDNTQNHRLASLQAQYDLVALRPTTEKSLQLCCSSLECDLISIDFSQRLPFILKFKTVASALQRGVRFEICYSPGVTASGAAGNNDARRNLISGATALIRATRGRGIILSSEAKNALGVRAPYDVMNLAQIWGLGQERGKEGVCEEAAKVLRLAGIKRSSFRGIVDIVDGVGDGGATTETNNKKTPESKTSALSQPASRIDSPAPSNGVKRKASGPVSLNTNLTANPVQSGEDGKPLSKRELKRRAKKARVEAYTDTNGAQSKEKNSTKQNDFPLKHEALVPQQKPVSQQPKKKS